MILQTPSRHSSTGTPTRDIIGAIGLRHLEQLVAFDSASDERSATIPSTEGQRVLADWLVTFFRTQGAEVTVDDHGNVLAALPGRGAGANLPPLAMMAHLDTARGTAPLPALQRLPGWDGQRVPYPANPSLCVDIPTYPATATFRGQELVFGDGKAPFGLDDKLGLAHIMTLAVLLRRNETIEHPPLLLCARPDEEIGRMAAVEDLADELARRGVRIGWTIDGIVPFEINVENFYAAGAAVRFADAPEATLPALRGALAVHLGGVNTHGATAKAEGHRAAVRLAVELRAELQQQGLGDAVLPASLVCDPLRDCDGELTLALTTDAPADIADRVAAAAVKVVGPHVPRGASFAVRPVSTDEVSAAAADGLCRSLGFVRALLAERAVLPVAAEDSEGRQGYSQPYRIRRDGDATVVDVRLRDFDDDQLRLRGEIVRKTAGDDATVQLVEQYVNMGPRLRDVAELAELPMRAAEAIGVKAEILPIRGGTGVDPFLDRGVFVANLGTGYFAPESEKEFTSVEQIADHARWLLALVQRAALG